MSDAPRRAFAAGVAAWAAAAAVTGLLADHGRVPAGRPLVELAAAVAVLCGLAALAGRFAWFAPVAHQGRRVAALGVAVAAWEIVTAKTGWLPLPFFPSPQAVLDVYRVDSARLAQSVFSSLLILVPGFALGAVTGFLAGLAMGWSPEARYWGHPVIRLLGPLPSIAWLPVALFVFPTIASASIFLIALATAFPVAVLTASGVTLVDSRLYDVGRTLGASNGFLIRTIVIPATLPHLFVGLFMGLGASFIVLIVAEMLGAKAGLGWYLQWAQGWAAYANLYAALAVMSVLFSGLTMALFAARRRALRWNRETVQW
ncbi:ABC transporter permease [Gluconacetobacter sacchari]|uniref:ABC transporter permease subunit n=2 Tax=Gluconacetobacter sacchari TaxID=92759 RepID=A0A7W4NPX6_9PROT|nr:ABC transporter permease subunit [Gluconacetobacter sacchari]MBB2161922.1 ABC transporter permease subunit [Gluconacetobacter sacchari]